MPPPGHRHLLATLVLTLPLAVITGTIVAVFLVSLDLVTRTRFDHPWLLWTLPLLGGLGGWIYHRVGGPAGAGNNLIIEQIHTPGGGVPRRMAPLVVIGTLLTHLGGGSAGREGTAVQVGGSVAGAFCRHLRLPPEIARGLLMAGVAAGFGAVFGTPLAGAIFAIEVLSIGRMSYDALLPCLLAAVVGDCVCAAWDVQWLGLHLRVHHTPYALGDYARTAAGLQPVRLLKVGLAAVAFGLASIGFVRLTHGVAAAFRAFIAYPPLRPVVGGALVIALTYALGTRDYLGLGVAPDPHSPDGVSIVSAFHAGGTGPLAWAAKTLFTAVTVGSGFRGGEVTPLFFVGTTLGNALAGPLGVPVDLLAALGFVAVFAGATKTPLACTVMGIELFGASPGFAVYLAVACVGAYVVSGEHGIYPAQRGRVSNERALKRPDV